MYIQIFPHWLPFSLIQQATLLPCSLQKNKEIAQNMFPNDSEYIYNFALRLLKLSESKYKIRRPALWRGKILSTS